MGCTPRLLLLLAATALSAGCGSPPGAREASELLERGEFDRAAELANAELKNHPEHPTLWQIKVSADMGRGDHQAAVGNYNTWFGLRGREHDESLLRSMAMTTLRQSLRVSSPEIRAQAIVVVERLAIMDLAEDVARSLGDDDDLVAGAAAIALLNSHPQAPKLAARLLSSDSPKARALVVAGIARKLKSEARKLAHPDIIAALADPAAEVRRAAISALASYSVPADTQRLIALAGTDEDGQVRARALRALTSGRRKGAVDRATYALDDPYLGVKLAAIDYLAKLGGDLGTGSLVKAAADDDLLVALSAAIALYRLGKGDASATIKAALAHASWTVRASAMNQVSDAVPRDAALRLAGAGLADSSIQVRLAAARSLVALGNRRRAREEFARALTAPEEQARLDAAIDLLAMKDGRGTAALDKLCASPRDGIRSSCIAAHRMVGKATMALVRGVADAKASNRILAAEILLSQLD